MNKDLKKVFILELFFASINVYVSIFINFFFWKNDKTFESLFLFNGLLFIFAFFGYIVGTYFLSKSKPKLCYYGSAISSVLLFLVLLNENNIEHIHLLLLVALFSGNMMGLFYAVTNHFVSLLANSDEIKVYQSRSEYLKTITAIGLPVINGFLIVHFGFYVSFFLMLVISIFYFLMANKIPKVKVEYKNLSWKRIKNIKYSNRFVVFTITTIIALQFSTIIQSILLFQLSANELIVSYLNIANVVTVTLCLVFVSKIKGLKMTKQFEIFSMVVIGALIVLSISGNEMTYFISMVLMIGSVFLYRYAVATISFQVINKSSGEEKLILLVKRELYLVVGRALVFFILYFFVKDISSANLNFFIYFVLANVIITTLYLKDLTTD